MAVIARIVAFVRDGFRSSGVYAEKRLYLAEFPLLLLYGNCLCLRLSLCVSVCMEQWICKTLSS